MARDADSREEVYCNLVRATPICLGEIEWPYTLSLQQSAKPDRAERTDLKGIIFAGMSISPFENFVSRSRKFGIFR